MLRRIVRPEGSGRHEIAASTGIARSPRRSLAVALLLSAIAPFTAASRSPPTPTRPSAQWKTFDDKTGQARAIVRIYEQDGKLFGKIERSMTPGAEHRVCAVCTDDRKDQPMLGLIIIRNMKRTGRRVRGGDILDPDTGSVYHCKMHVEGGTRLVVRGYIGLSLLGRNQTWQRVPASS